MKYVLYAFLLYILYNFIFKLVIPIYTTTRKVKKGFRQMQEQMQEKVRQQQQAWDEHTDRQNQSPKHKAGDYIEFEDVK